MTPIFVEDYIEKTENILKVNYSDNYIAVMITEYWPVSMYSNFEEVENAAINFLNFEVSIGDKWDDKKLLLLRNFPFEWDGFIMKWKITEVNFDKWLLKEGLEDSKEVVINQLSKFVHVYKL